MARAPPGDDVAKAPFNRLGYLSFDSNERSNHQVRWNDGMQLPPSPLAVPARLCHLTASLSVCLPLDLLSQRNCLKLMIAIGFRRVSSRACT